MGSSRRHSVSSDHHHRHHRSHRDDDGYDRDSAYASRNETSPRHRHRYEDYDAAPYISRRAASRPTRMTSTRPHSPDSWHRQDDRTRGRRLHDYDDDDDYDPRDKYYLSGDESAGWRSRSQPRPSAHNTRDGDDYFGSYHNRFPSRREPSRRSSPRRSSHSRHRRHHHADEDDDDRRHHESRGRRGAPPMPRRQSSSAPPPSSRKYPPPSSHNRHSRHGGGSSSTSKYPPSSADNRKKTRSMSFGGSSSKSKSKDGNRDGGRSSSKGGDGGAFGDVPWSAAARCALEAGTMAALKAHGHPGQWIGTKGAQVATAAVGAALVDGFIANKNPGIRGGKRHAVLRQVTNAALSNLVMNPVAKTAEEKKPQIHNAGRNFARHMGSPIHRHKRW